MALISLAICTFWSSVATPDSERISPLINARIAYSSLGSSVVCTSRCKARTCFIDSSPDFQPMSIKSATKTPRTSGRCQAFANGAAAETACFVILGSAPTADAAEAAMRYTS
jgi:hypothetical protein